MALRQENDAVASKLSIFSKNHDYNILKSFPCHSEHVCRYGV